MADWGFGLLGGLMIGTAAAILLLGTGRIAGISGIVGEALAGRRLDDGLPFLAGLIGAPAVAAIMTGAPVVAPSAPTGVLVVAGFLVGIGTRIGNGCTSGHGVCGLSRLSPRSIAATAAFMSAAVVTVFVTRHLLGGA
ncbi:YeeE/YedE family protein [Limibaculum sp. M0105]|uniref:YeeE/YedE family protein n=1 Tax=Thermohalobaculum xanthum TaxID=2753746 RepID=A0A8J7SEK5_9RHOB|nr:YeeE/YedE family protein [Thermohalobaculum xanthum]MBK0399883.1 YeeE/YedE family protein [Thermohalobaculum xanthum]